MTATTSKLGADMLTDEQIESARGAADKECPLGPVNIRWYRAFARALLAGQPAAIDKEGLLRKIRITCESRFVKMGDDYALGANQVARDVVRLLDAAPLATESSKPAASETRWYKHIDAEGNPYWLHTPPAAPSVEQDERGACLCTRCNCWVRPSDDCSVCNRAASTSAKVEAQDKMAIDELGMHDAARKLVQSLGYVWTDGEWCYGSGARAASTSANVAQGAEAVAHKCALCGSSGACESSDARLNYECGGAWYRPSAANASQPAQKVLTDDARDAKRYRRLRQCNSGSLVIVQIIGTGEDDQIVLTEEHADEAIDAALSQHKAGEKDE